MSVLLVIALLFVLMAIRMPVGFAIAISGSVGLLVAGGPEMLLGVLQTTPISVTGQYSLSPIPLFILMAQFVLASGVMDDLFEAGRVWMGRIRGGTGVAAIGAGALFAAVSGSSTAAAATLAQTSSTRMISQGYSPRAAGGIVSAVGTLASMIPPSIVLVFYAVLAEESVGKILIAGIVPGVMVAIAIALSFVGWLVVNPSIAPHGNPQPWKTKLASIRSVAPVLLLFLLVTGTVYFGVATPTEAAAVGVLGAVVIAAIRRTLTFAVVKKSVTETLMSTAMILMIILGAYILGYFITATRVTESAITWVSGLPVAPVLIVLIIGVCYIILGFFLDQMAILALTVPMVLPIIEELGYDPIWFGVVVVLLAEIGLVTPPLGLNVFVVARSTSRPTGEIFLGTLPFAAAAACIALIGIFWPDIFVWLPNTMTEATNP